ncbi:MBL fold metallo-hydrolase, partial [Roseibium sp.]
MAKAARRASWIRVRPEGLHVEPGGFHVDPTRAVDRAIITHGHADHARPGHGAVAATAETLAIMRVRYGEMPFKSSQALRFGEKITINGVTVSLMPAGHVLGSAQVVLEYRGERVVVSGDYKRRPDLTCTGFEPVPCDVFITEATFGLPVFRHPEDRHEIATLMHSHALFPERCHVIGTYSLGKAQRLISLIR